MYAKTVTILFDSYFTTIPFRIGLDLTLMKTWKATGEIEKILSWNFSE